MFSFDLEGKDASGLTLFTTSHTNADLNETVKTFMALCPECVIFRVTVALPERPVKE